MNGREPRDANNLFYVCSIIEYIARSTKNHRSTVVDALGRERLQHLYDLADVYHSDNPDRVSGDLIEECAIEEGNFDNVADCGYTIPSCWDMGKVRSPLTP